MLHFYNSLKRQKTYGFLTFSMDIENLRANIDNFKTHAENLFKNAKALVFKKTVKVPY